MTELQDFLSRSSAAKPDWSESPWAAAQPALHLLGLAPEPTARESRAAPLGPEDVNAIETAMIDALRHTEEAWSWSSYLLLRIIEASEAAEGGPPDALLRNIDRQTPCAPVTKNQYEFCRALNAQLIGKYGWKTAFDLAWLAEEPPSPAHACLRVWLMVFRSDLFSDADEQRLMVHLVDSGFAF